MIYREFKDLKLSTLGYGGMRLPTNKKNEKIDRVKAAELIDYAYNNGVNLFDTAFFYHGGESEFVLGEELKKYPRDTWYLADKFPGNMISVENGKMLFDAEWAGMKKMTFNNPAEVFEHQLKNCSVDYFDFYMIHNITESTYDLYTDEKIGIISYLCDEKKAGRIKHLGISTHGRYETIDKFLDSYDCFEFALMQLNYLDWSLQEANKKCDVLTKHNIPIFVMEPVRGGLLAAPGEEAEEALKAVKPGDTPASWAFRFLQSLPNVYVTVSGMTTMEQLKENLELFNKNDPLNDSDKALLQKIVDGMATFVPCTSCRYCIGVCPQKLDIPMLIATYNEASNVMGWYVEDVLDTLEDDKIPQACIGCGACNPLCPQNIDIADTMKSFCELLKKV
ncbi:MAG: aldo/keto reductase [Oscillospiraceae bacterium]|nr:aldo/keto reductase [Oscillospiraceae bacterium]